MTEKQGKESRKDTGDREYVVVARRYRPQTFDELIGQEHVAKALQGAIKSHRVGHAYLFTGARGVGKTSAARILAKALDCEQGPTRVPCNQCEICEGVGTGDDVDVLEIDGASNRGIDEIRQLRSNVNIRPSRARFKIYIIDEVHMLTAPAFNALLKTLEEPPEHVKFIFCTTDPEKIPITVLSRCQRFDFAGIDRDAIVTRLAQIAEKEGATPDPEALHLLARRAAGSMRDSQSLLEQLLATGGDHITAADVHEMLGTADSTRLLALARHIADHDAAAALNELDSALADGVDVGQLLEQLVGVFRDIMVALSGCDGELFLHAVSDEDSAAVQAIAGELGLQTTLAILQILAQAASSLRYTTQPRTVAELALVRASKLENLDELATLISELRDLESSDAPPPEPTRASRSTRQAPKKKSEPSQPSVDTKPEAGAGDAEVPVKEAVPVEEEVSVKEEVQVKQEVPVKGDTTSPSDKLDEPALALTEENARQIWEQTLGKLSGMVQAKAREFDGLSLPAPNRLVVSFAETYNLCKSYCERPDQAARIREALHEITGSKVEVVFVLAEGGSATDSSSPRVTRQQTRVAVNSNPLVQKANELFGARPVDISRPK